MQKRILKSELMFFIAYGLMCIYNLLFQKSELSSMFNSDIIEKVVYLIVLIALIIKIISTTSTIKKSTLALIIIFMFIVAISAFNSDAKLLIFQILIIICAKDIDFNKIIKLDLIIKIISVILLFTLSKAEMINNYQTINNGLIKTAYGWQHPNMFGATILTICIEIIYLLWNKKYLKYYYPIFIIMIFLLNSYSASRTQLYTFTVLLLWIMIIRIYPKLSKEKIVITNYKV